MGVGKDSCFWNFGAVVTQNVASNVVVADNPARVGKARVGKTEVTWDRSLNLDERNLENPYFCLSWLHRDFSLRR